MTTTLQNGSFSEELFSNESARRNESFEYETDSDDTKFQSYIVGGKYARIQDFPHSAFLVIKCHKVEYEEFTCGSSILNQLILLTAAHCFEDCRSGSKVLVSVGNRRKTKGNFYTVGKFASHGEYDGHVMKNDIAVAILSRPLVFGSSVKRVLLSHIGIYKEPALVAGWGITNEKLYTPTLYLKWTRQVVLSRRRCLRLVPNLNNGYFCATGDVKHETDYGYAAVGDSGSALIVRRSIQIGIVSYKIPKTSKSLIIYTNVTKYHHWITSASKQLYCHQFKFT
ncbi:chymotrypsin-1-like [Hyposmocoma kahamanoa]|uniref:chymotrypsin-1-like n=1 Tax=Hyposmocoma kahamanoa TaxID=1477025 RepID=UPI000E6D7191|nr:chymotrypsin-1-like [Hyposmocoma kahamanoa]